MTGDRGGWEHSGVGSGREETEDRLEDWYCCGRLPSEMDMEPDGEGDIEEGVIIIVECRGCE